MPFVSKHLEMASRFAITIISIIVLLCFASLGAADEAKDAFEAEVQYIEQYSKQRNWRKAIQAAKRALRHGAQSNEVDKGAIIQVELKLALTLAESGDHRQAKRLIKRVIQNTETLYGKNALQVAHLLTDIVIAPNYRTSSRQQYLDRADQIMRTEHGESSIKYGKFAMTVGKSLDNYFQHPASARLLDTALEIFSADPEKTPDLYRQALYYKAQQAFRSKEFDRAIALNQKALTLLESSDPKAAYAWEIAIRRSLFRTYKMSSRDNEATEQLRAISKLRVAHGVPGLWAVYQVSPDIPRHIIGRRIEGKVTLKLDVTAEGKVENVEVISATGYPRYKQYALDAVAQYRYSPDYKDGQFVESRGITTTMTITHIDSHLGSVKGIASFNERDR